MGKSIDQIKRPLGWAGFAFCLASSTAAYALGFGAIELDSALNEPLDARILVTSLSADERRSLSVTMARPEVFERFGVARAAIVDNIEITAESRGSGPLVIRLTSQHPVQEPFLSFLIAADTDSGRTLREYTVLLDPPGWTRRETPPVAAPQARSAARPRPAPATDEMTTSAGDSDAPAVASPRAAGPRGGTTAASDGRRRYGPVAAGDTLWQIARRMRTEGVSARQMLVAIYRANPSAFGGDIDLLLADSMLTIPSAAQASAVDASAARRILRAEQAEQAQPTPQVAVAAAGAAPVAATEPEPEPETGDDTGIEDNAEVEAAPASGGGQLRLEAAQRYHSTDGSVATTASDERFMAALTGPGFSTLTAAAAVAPAPAAAARTRVADAVPQTGGTRSDDAAAQAEASAQRPENRLAAGIHGPAVDVAAGVKAEAVSATASAGAAGDEGDWLIPGSERDVAAAGYQASLLSPSNILLLLAAIGLLMALLLRQRRRQYRPVPADFSGHFDATDGAVVLGDAAPGAFGTADSAAPAETPSAPGVAPDQRVQDAENQIAIGLFDQARETLEQGLAQHPDHASLQDKLLELDYVNGDAQRFRADVERFRSALLRNGVRWAGISAMGRVLAPEDPRFAFGRSQAETSPPTPDQSAQLKQPPLSPDTDAGASARDERRDEESVDAPAPDPAVDDVRPAPPAQGPYISESRPQERPAYTVPPADQPRPEHPQPSATPASVEPDELQSSSHDDGLDLDTQSTNLGGNDWTTTPVADQDPPSHDDYSHAFDLDTAAMDTPADADSGNVSGKTDDAAGDDASSFDIDLSEFDMDGDADTEASPPEDDADPVEMRLDVARMYLEMQDPGSARGLLHEVIEDGDAEQRSTAQALLDQLG